jgi:aryl-alcohol dehydrogenase-like predicted oxidoreductase
VKQRNLGKSGLLVSEVGLGCNNFGSRLDIAGTRAVVAAALDLGVSFFDTADVYARPHPGRSEEYLGTVLGADRKRIVLASKFGGAMPEGRGGSRRWVMQAVEDSLRRLKTDWIDLYQFHRPDPLTPVEETLRAMQDLVTQGKVRYIGISNFAPWQVADAVWTARELGGAGIVSCQDEYSVLSRDPDSGQLEAMQHYGLGLLPYFPLASGMLTGKYRREALPNQGTRLVSSPLLRDHFLTDANLAMVEKLQAFCDARGHTMVELAFSWLLARPCVASVIAGASNRAQLEQNVAATGWALSAADMAELDAISPPPPRMVHV